MDFIRYIVGACFFASVGCAIDHGTEGYWRPPPQDGPMAIDDSALISQLMSVREFCARPYHDPISLDLCRAPSIRDLTSLERALRLDDASLALNGNSASLVARRVNPLNPRVILFRARPLMLDEDFAAMAFTRGEPYVELVSRDFSSGDLRFFLIGFSLPCMASGRCGRRDMLTEAVEKNWTGMWIATDDDLRNTTKDCLRCHQAEGPGTAKILRMQELKRPWTHWFITGGPGTTPSGQLLEDFRKAHPDGESYGGVPVTRIASESNPAGLESAVESMGFEQQPNEFLTEKIESEVEFSSDQSSPTWDQLYAKVVIGRAIPVPFRLIRPTHPFVQERATVSYADFVDPQVPTGQLWDISALLSEEAERAMSIRPRLGSSGREILVQMCQGCHNSRLDQSISRAKFNVETLDVMSREEKDLAIARMHLATSSPFKMPPVLESELTEDEAQLAIGELSQ